MARLLINPAWADELAALGLRTFADFFHFAGGQLIRARPRKTRTVVRLDAAGIPCFLKREHGTRLKDYWRNWWAGFGFVSKSRREWEVLNLLRERGLNCPEPIAVGERGTLAFLLVRGLEGTVELHRYLARKEVRRPAVRQALLCQLGVTLARFHGAGFSHPDLFPHHVFVRESDQSIFLIDLQRSQAGRPLSWNQRWRDLASLHTALSDALVSSRERLGCLRVYLRESGTPYLRQLWRHAVGAIERRGHHLLRRRKFREMRRQQETGSDWRLVDFPGEELTPVHAASVPPAGANCWPKKRGPIHRLKGTGA